MLGRKQSLVKRIIIFFLDLLFPINCYGCLKGGEYLCDNCFKKLLFQEKKVSDYKLLRNNLSDIFIAGDYDNKLLAVLIKTFKYKRVKGIGKELAKFLIFFWEGRLKSFELENRNNFLSQAVVIPLPLSTRRKRERGFNQTEIIADFFCQEFSYSTFLSLKRKHRRKHQAQLKELDRLRSVGNSFYCSSSELKKIVNKRIILIDDVITTGATLNEAAGFLLKAGAKEVFALVLAKG